MKKLLGILVLGLLFISAPSLADDISEFEIEGMSIGDSLLDYLSEQEILNQINNNKYMYTHLTNEFGEVYMRDGLSQYLFVSFFVKQNDKNFIIYGITGTMPHSENIAECHQQMNEIADEFSTLFNDAKKTNSNFNHRADKTARSKGKAINFTLKFENKARIVCYDFEENLRIKNNWLDGLNIELYTKEILDWFY